MKLIGLSGRAGSGKDTVASLLLENHVTGRAMAFADPLRQAAQAIFGLTLEQMTDRVQKEKEVPFWGLSPRQILQRLGTESVRDVFGPDTWVRRAQLAVETLVACDQLEPLATDVLIFTDTRFDEEARWIHDEGGVAIEVVRPHATPVSAHRSEQGLSPELIDFTLLNTGTLAQLPAWVNISAARWLNQADEMLLHGRAA